MQIFTGSTNPALAKNIAKQAGYSFGKVELSRFPNGEVRVWVTEEKVDKEVAVVQSFVRHPNRAIMEFCLLVDALRRSGAKEITAIIPWMGYCIQDKIFRQGEPLSARVVADVIESTQVDLVITVDLHNESIQGFFNIPMVHLSAVPLYIEMFSKGNSSVAPTQTMVVAPDVGALKETTEIAHQLGQAQGTTPTESLPIAVLNKQRDRHTGKVSIVGVEGEVAGKTALIMDDFISTGGTLVQTADYLKKQGMEKIIVAVTHHLYLDGVMEKLAQSGIDELYVTDTMNGRDAINRVSTKKFQLHIVSVAEMIAKAL